MGKAAAFFYGTLMHPKILKNVLKNDGSHLDLCPAVLFDFTRHQVKRAEYPGMVPSTKSEQVFNRELTREERSVRGMLVAGLTKRDLAALDAFEGAMYERVEVSVHPLEKFQDISAHLVKEERLSEHPPPLPLPAELLPPIPALTYVFCDADELKAELWSFKHFITENTRNRYRRNLCR